MRLLAWLLLLPLPALAQVAVTGRVLDAGTREPLPYASIGVQGSVRFTLANEEGTFSIVADTLRDSLRVALIGYRTRVVSARDVAANSIVLLQPTAKELPSFTVKGSDAQYERVARVAKALREQGNGSARAYFELETYLEGQPVEVIECFYNAELAGARVRDLHLKHGRIGVAPVQTREGGQRYFVSLNTTKAVTLFDPTAANDHYPATPFQWTKAKAIKKRYRAELLSTDDSGTDLLRLTPRDTSGNAFTVDLWLRRSDDHVLAYELRCNACAPVPFEPYKAMDRIHSTDLRIKHVWRSDANTLQHTELSYAMDYEGMGRREHVRTNAVLHLFDPGGAFMLPLFDYDQEQPDYRKILLQPYDSVFWQQAPALVSTAQQQRDRAFLRTHGTFTGFRKPDGTGKADFFESNCAWWSAEKRISLKSLPPPPDDGMRPANYQQRGATVPATQVNLEAQLYLDMDTTGGTLRVFSATLLDGFRSYYHLPEERHTDCFINLFFDLCELERRTMQAELQQPSMTAEQARSIHSSWTNHMRDLSRRYMKETALGSDHNALLKWNDKVKEALGIDNMALFGLLEK